MKNKKQTETIGFILGLFIAAVCLTLFESFIIWSILHTLVKVTVGFWQVVGGVIIWRLLLSNPLTKTKS